MEFAILSLSLFLALQNRALNQNASIEIDKNFLITFLFLTNINLKSAE